MKTCSKCGRPKRVSAFYSDKSRRDGLSSRCKPCILEDREAYREANREKLRLGAIEDRRANPHRGCWQRMLRRCYSPDDGGFSNYGGRGIRVCARWRDSYDAFVSDMGPRPSLAHTVDRIDVNGDYKPSNCRWATPKEQARNTRVNRLLTVDGETLCMSEWAERSGLSVGLVRDRIDILGWPVERALSEPADKRFGPRSKAC